MQRQPIPLRPPRMLGRKRSTLQPFAGTHRRPHQKQRLVAAEQIQPLRLWIVQPDAQPGRGVHVDGTVLHQPLKERRQRLPRVADRVGDPLPLRLPVQQVTLHIVSPHPAQWSTVQPAQEAAQFLMVALDGARAVIPILQVGQEAPVEDPVVSDPAQLQVLVQAPVVVDLAFELQRPDSMRCHARFSFSVRHGDHIVPRGRGNVNSHKRWSVRFAICGTASSTVVSS